MLFKPLTDAQKYRLRQQQQARHKTDGSMNGAFWADSIAAWVGDVYKKGLDGNWYLARPLPYYSLRARLKQAWDVLTYKADALYWLIDFK